MISDEKAYLKSCTKCGKDYKFFPKRKLIRGGEELCQKCRKCHSSKNYYKKQILNEELKDRYRDNVYKSKYNFSLAQYNNLFNEQEGCCAICNKHQIQLDKRLAVDHNHETEETRGLLCMDCNTSLGKFKDSIEILQRAIEYLRKYNKS
jgi:hypothetical protein